MWNIDGGNVDGGDSDVHVVTVGISIYSRTYLVISKNTVNE